MRIFRSVLGKNPSRPKGRVRNFIANKELGTLSDIHENVISPGVTVPWHFHETEEVIVVLAGNGECKSDQGTEVEQLRAVVVSDNERPQQRNHTHKNHVIRRNPGPGMNGTKEFLRNGVAASHPIKQARRPELRSHA